MHLLKNADSSLAKRLLLVILMPVIAGSIFYFGQNLHLLLLAAALGVPALLVAIKNIQGVLLPYAAGSGLIYLGLVLHLSAESHNLALALLPNNLVVRFWQLERIEALVLATALAVLLSLLAFAATSIKRSSLNVAANLLFRTIAVLLILVSPVVALNIVRQYEDKAAHVRYLQALESYNKRTLKDDVPLFAFKTPAGYRLQQTGAADDLLVHEAYQYYYSSEDGRYSITAKVSKETLPKTCEQTITPRLQTDTRGDLFSCNIVYTASNGQAVYGYRDRIIVGTRTLGLDPARLTTQQLRTLQPDKFYIVKDNALITLTASEPGDRRSYPITQDVLNGLAGSIRLVTDSERQAFIHEHIKLNKPTDPAMYPSSTLKVGSLFFGAAYLAILLWALEKVFQKAGKKYWQVYVPIVNLWLLVKMAARPGWWSLLAYVDTNPATVNPALMLALLAYFPPILYIMIALTALRLALFALVSYSLAKKFGKHSLFSLLLICPPFLGYIFLGFDKSQYKTDSGGDDSHEA